MESRDAYFDRVYDENAAQLKRFIVARIRSVSDMEDVYQETWQRFYERTARIRPTEPVRYLIKIAKGELAKRYRSQSRKNENEEPLTDVVADRQAPFEQALLERMDAAKVWSIVKTEPLLSYQSFVLYYGFDQPCGRSQKRCTSARTRSRRDCIAPGNESARNGKEPTSNDGT
jgi:DNA-directed RNA polymerase specialized sigma24 family protein